MTSVDEVECKLLSDLIQERFGLCFGGVRQEILVSRVRGRLKVLRLGSLLDYYHFLRCHPQRDEERAIVKATTAETAHDLQAVLTAGDILAIQKMVRKVPVSDHVRPTLFSSLARTRQ